MKINMHKYLLMLLPIIIIIIIIVCINYIESNRNINFQTPIYYTFKNIDMNKEINLKDWNYISDIKKLNAISKKKKMIWLKMDISKDDISNIKGLYFEKIYGQSIEIYNKKKIIYSKKRQYLFDINKVILPLSSFNKNENLTLYIKLSSIYGKIGFRNKIIIDNTDIVYREYFFSSLFDVILGSSFTLIGVFLFLLFIFMKGNNKYAVLSISIIQISVGNIFFLYPSGLILFKNIDQILVSIVSISTFLFMIFLTYFFLNMFGNGYKNSLLIGFKIQVYYSIFSLFIILLNILFDYKLMKFEFITTICIFGIITVIQILLILSNLMYLYRLTNNNYIKTILFGYTIFGIILIIELILFIFYKDYTISLWKIGLTFFIGVLIVIVGKKESKNYFKLIRYTKKLECKNLKINEMYDEIKYSKDKLDLFNKTLEYKILKRTKELELSNKKTSQINSELKNTIKILKSSQLKNIEKIAFLENLLPNIVTDLNSPIEKIQSSIINISSSLNQTKKIATWDEDKIIFFNIDEILFFTSEKRIIIATTVKGVFKVKNTITQLENYLKKYLFFRVHKSFLVNSKYVKKIEPSFTGKSIFLCYENSKKYEIPLSKNYEKSVKNILGLNII